MLGDRLDEHLPDVGGADDPLGAAPGRGRGHAGGEVGGLVEPVVGEPHGVGDGVAAASGTGSGRTPGDGLAGHVEGDVPVERAVVGLHHRLQLAEELVEVGHAARRLPKNCSNGVPLKGFWPLVGVVAHGLHGTRIGQPRRRPPGATRVVPCPTRRPVPTRDPWSAWSDLREEPLDVAEVLDALEDDAAGGLTLFVGRVRDHDHGTGVDGLDYSAHPTALDAAARRVRARRRRPRRARGLRRGAPRRQPRRSATSRSSSPPRPPTAARRSTRVPGADRHAQGRGADLEAPALRRRHRGVGRRALSVRGRPLAAYPRRVEILFWLVPPSSSRWWRWCGWPGWAVRAAARSTATSPYAGWPRRMQREHAATTGASAPRRPRDRSTGIAVRPSRAPQAGAPGRGTVRDAGPGTRVAAPDVPLVSTRLRGLAA